VNCLFNEKRDIMTKLAKLLVLVSIPAAILMGCASGHHGSNEYWDDTNERSGRMEKEMYKDK
jgi:hypothetical protein